MTFRPWKTLADAWLILVLASVFGASLAAVHAGLSGRIESNKRAETLRQLPALVFGAEALRDSTVRVRDDGIEIEGESGDLMMLAVDERELAGRRVYGVSRTEDGTLAGWVIKGSGQGYADVIELLVGVDPSGEKITGLFVLSQKETPALGDGITREDFRNRFVGRATASQLRAAQGAGSGQDILALTAATISSQSVCDIINRALAEVAPLLSSPGPSPEKRADSESRGKEPGRS